MSTKQKISIQALKLFNENGIADVSLRDIAAKAEISIGNLQYHFKKREEIIDDLYFELVEKMNEQFIIKEEDLMVIFFKKSVDVMNTLFEYRFFFLNFVTIVRRSPKIKQHYKKLSKQREKETLHIIDLLINHGLFRKELLKNEYRMLFKKIEVLSNFWFSSILIKSNDLHKKSISEYAGIMSYSIFPYLTAKGRKKFEQEFPKYLN